MKDITIIDTGYIHSGVAASYALPVKDGVVIVEVNTNQAVEIILKTLLDQNYTPEEVKAVILTHIHLDHAGGAGKIMEICPNAELIVHPRGKRHMSDPSRLEKSARIVYGDEQFEKLYGVLKPVSEERIRTVEDGERILTGEREFVFYHTPGHAKHHVCIHDTLSNGIFTGDTFGLCYGILQEKGMFMIPATTAVDFDPVSAKESLLRILSTGADQAYLTHFGCVTEMKEAASQLTQDLNYCESLLIQTAEKKLQGKDAENFCYESLSKYCFDKAKRMGLSMTDDQKYFLNLDMGINAGGIAHAASLMMN